ncbi:MAG: hypothetical protein Q9157_002734 [Trypethelium eluteriae]
MMDLLAVVLNQASDSNKDPVDIMISGRPVAYGYAPQFDYYSHAPFYATGHPPNDQFFKNKAAVEEILPGKENTKLQIRRILSPITKADTWRFRIKGPARDWFPVDEFDDNVRRDSEQYLQFATLRIIEFMDYHGIPRQGHYRIFTDPSSLTELQPGPRHIASKWDFTWSMNMQEIKQVVQILDKYKNGPVVDWKGRGNDVYNLMDRHIKRLRNDLSSAKPLPKIYGFDDLVNFHKSEPPKWLVGGGLTEFAKYQASHATKGADVMGGYMNGDSNIFEQQTNFKFDPQSAWKALEHATKDAPVTLFITEFCKQSTWVLKSQDIHDNLKQDGALIDWFNKYYMYDLLSNSAAWQDNGDQGKKVSIPTFDLVTGLYHFRPDLFPKPVSVRPYQQRSNDTGELLIKLEAGGTGAVLAMWQDDKMAQPPEVRDAFMKVLAHVFQPANSTHRPPMPAVIKAKSASGHQKRHLTERPTKFARRHWKELPN